MYCYSPCPQTWSRPPPTQVFIGNSWTLTGKSPVGSLFLSPGSWCARFCCALQVSISQSYVSSGSSTVGLMAISSKSTYSIPTPRAPVPVADHCWPIPPQEMLKHSSVSVSVGFLGPGAHKVWLSSLSFSGGNGGLIFNVNLPFLPSCWGFSFGLGHEVSPHSCSSAYCLTAVSLTLDVGYLHMATPAKCRRHSWAWMWEQWQTLFIFLGGASKITADGDYSHKIKKTSWKKSYDQPGQHIKKQRHYFANKGPSSQGYGFSSSHVWMWDLDYKEIWVLKNWCFWTVVLEKTLESPFGL